jgi:RNA recognition motif-containing protein
MQIAGMDIQVNNISLNMSDADVRRLFSTFGIVDSAEVGRDKYNGRSKGNAHVCMPNAAQARQAIVSLDQTMMDGKKISVVELPSVIY